MDFKVLLTFVGEDGDEPIFSAASTYVPRAGDTVTYSMEADDRDDWNEEAWNEKHAVSGKEWTVVRVHHDFRRMSVSLSLSQRLRYYTYT